MVGRRIQSGEMSVSVTEFRTHCHALLRRLAGRCLRRIVLTKHGKRVAALVPFPPRPRGALKGTVFIPPGVDITEPTGEVWDAEQDKQERGS